MFICLCITANLEQTPFGRDVTIKLPIGRWSAIAYIESYQKSIDYIEEHLKERITVEILAEIAGFSAYHYYRLFNAYVGMPVMEYVRRRRLEHAVTELSGNKRIIDIAMDYGFESHSGFGKAFRKIYGCSPEQYRIHATGNIPSKVDLRLLQQFNLSGGIILEPKIITKPSFKVIGYALETTLEDNRRKRDIPAFWDHFNVEGLEANLYAMIQPKEHGEFCICFPPNMETGQFTYVIAVKTDNFEGMPEDLYKGEVPEATYAVFTTPPADYNDKGFVQAIEGTWRFIFEKWFPTSGYEFAADKVDFEFYDERCHPQIGAVMEIYIPVTKA